MNFEHLIEINDPNNLFIEPLSREQLWQGLVLRAEQPELTVMALDACTILARAEGYLKRELRFGSLRIVDEVTLTPMQHVTYDIIASENYPTSGLYMGIEEPATGHLFIRFIYSSQDDQTDEMVRDHLKEAYTQADLDTVAVIRELASLGKLGEFTLTPSSRLN